MVAGFENAGAKVARLTKLYEAALRLARARGMSSFRRRGIEVTEEAEAAADALRALGVDPDPSEDAPEPPAPPSPNDGRWWRATVKNTPGVAFLVRRTLDGLWDLRRATETESEATPGVPSDYIANMVTIDVAAGPVE